MSIASDILSSIEELKSSDLQEAMARRMISFSGGTRHIKLKCGPGFKLVNNICQRMRSTEILSRRRAAKKAGRSRRSHRMQMNNKRRMTMRRRHSAGL